MARGLCALRTRRGSDALTCCFAAPRRPRRPRRPRSLHACAGLRQSAWACALLLILALGKISPASAALRVRNDARHADLWFRLYDELPRAWKTRRDVLLREMPARDVERLAAQLGADEGDRNDDSVIDGCYQNGEGDDDPPIITICDTLRGEQAGLVFAHEYGHFVWDALLNDEQRVRYARLWRGQKRAHRLVTEYARESEEEGFAEAFAYFTRRPATLTRKDALSAQFLRDIAAHPNSSADTDNAPDGPDRRSNAPRP